MKCIFFFVLIISSLKAQEVSIEGLKSYVDGVLFIEEKDGAHRLWTIHDLLKEWHHLPIDIRKAIEQVNLHSIQPEKKLRWGDDPLLQYESDEG